MNEMKVPRQELIKYHDINLNMNVHYSAIDAAVIQSDIYLMKFISKIIAAQLWQYPDMKKFITWSNSRIKSISIDDISRDLYAEYFNKYKEYKIEKDEHNEFTLKDRGLNRMKSIKKYILDVAIKTKYKINPTCYLDVGCYDGGITNAIASYFNLVKTQSYGIDIDKSESIDTTNFTFAKYAFFNHLLKIEKFQNLF
jgi:hypothetical protein